MKHLFKRGLSLLLAALMVVSMLPVSALADYSASGGQTYDLGADADPDVFTPIDAEEPSDDESSELPVVPGGGDDVGESWNTTGVTATISADGSWTVTITTSGVESAATPAGEWCVLLIPNATDGDPSHVLPCTLDEDTINDGQIDSRSALETYVVNKTGLKSTDYVLVNGNGTLKTSGDQNDFVISTDNELGRDHLFPTISTLQDSYPDCVKSGQIEVLVVAVCMSADPGTHVRFTKITYGEPPAQSGIPSTVYLLNKTTNTLTFVSGTLNGAAWTPDLSIPNGSVLVGPGAVTGDHGTWDGASTLKIPLYNKTGERISINVDDTKSKSSLISSSTTLNSIDGKSSGDRQFTDPQFNIELNINDAAGTIVIPIHAIGYEDLDRPSGATYDATITIQVVSGGLGMAIKPIIFDVQEGFDEAPSAVVQVEHVYDNSGEIEWATVVYNASFAPEPSLETTATWNWPLHGGTSLKEFMTVTRYPAAECATAKNSAGTISTVKDVMATNPDTNKGPHKYNPEGGLKGVSDQYLNYVTADGKTILTLDSDSTGSHWEAVDGAITTYHYDITVQPLMVRGRESTDTSVTNINGNNRAKIPVTVIVHPAPTAPEKVDVTYDYGDKGGSTVKNDDATVGEEYTINEPDPTWSGYKFLGWKVTAGADTSLEHLHQNDKVTGITGDVTLTAQWELVAAAEVTIRTVYDDDPASGGDAVPTAPGGDVVLKPESGAEIKLSSSTDNGVYTVKTSELTDGEYTVWVNGFKTGKTVSNSTGSTVDVKLVKIYTEVNTASETNHAYIEIGGSITESATSIYVPSGANNEHSDGAQISLQAVPGPNYRASKKVSGKSYSLTWTIKTALDDESSELRMDDTEKNRGEEVAALTLRGITEDHKLIAHFVALYTVNAKMDPGTMGNDTTIGASISDLVNAIVPQQHADITNQKVDEKGSITITTVPGTNKKLAYWTVTGSCTVHDGNSTSGTLHEDGGHYTTTGNSITIVPKADVTVTAFYASTTGSAEVTVKKNNTEWTEQEVKLRLDGTSGDQDIFLTDGDSSGKYTGGDIPAGTYHVYVNDEDTGETVEVESGTPAELELNYYTLKLVRHFDSGARSDDIKVGFEAGSMEASDTKEITFLDGTASQEIFATQTNKGVSARGPYYTFENWTVTAPDGSTGSFGGASAHDTTYNFPDKGTLATTGSAGITLTANYKAETYTVKFYRNYNDGDNDLITDGNAEQTGVAYNGHATDPTNPTRTGYTFKGWSTTRHGDTVTLSDTPITKDTDFYAIWEQGKSSIVFELQSGETIDDRGDKVEKSGDTGTEISEEDYPHDPKKTGYTFQGWTVKSGTPGGGSVGPFTSANKPHYPDAVGDTLTLQATWTPNPYTVTYDKGNNPDASVKAGESPVNVVYDQDDVTVKTSDILEGITAGWNFTGWSDGMGNTYQGTDTDRKTLPKITGDVTLTAQWTVDVTFNVNKPDGAAEVGSLTAPNQTPEAGGKLTEDQLAKPTGGTLTDYNFKGWYKDKVSEDDGPVDTNTTFDAPTTLYAHWTPKEYTLYFDPNGGTLADTGADGKVKKTGQANSKVADPGNPTLAHFTFDGWYWEEDEANKEIVELGTLTYTSENNEKTLKAKWTAIQYKYTFDPNGGKFTPDDGFTLTEDGKYQVKGEYESTITPPTPEHNPTRDGYAFKGWSETRGGTDAIDYTSGKVKMPDAEETTVYAIWEARYNIKYDANGHGTKNGGIDQTDLTSAGPHTVKTASEAFTDLADGERIDEAGSHWRFNGWNTKEGGDGTSIAGGGSVTFPQTDAANNTLTLYAQWVRQYKVTFGTPEKGGSTELGATTASAPFGETGSAGETTQRNSSDTLYVDEGKTVSVGKPSATAVGKTLYYAYWQADSGSFTGGELGETTKTTQDSDTFRPSGDATLTPYFLVGPTVSPSEHEYDIGKSAAENTPVVYTWTGNDATRTQLSGADYQLTMEGGTGDYSAGAAIDISKVKGVDGGDGKTYTFTFPDDFLKTLEVGEYTITFASNTGDDPTNLTTTLKIKATENQLLQVDIQANGGAATAKADGTVEYDSHLPETILPEKLLSYEWYYRDTAPAQTKEYQDPSNKGTLEGQFSGAVSIPGYTGSTVTVPKAAKGKYVFALVTATVTGKGLAITNAVPVDYDAAVKVTKDGGDDITGGNYKVYLVPTGEARDDSYTGSALPASKVEATYAGSDNIYKTADNALTGGETYAVYANMVEGKTGDADYFVKVAGITISTQTSDGGTIEYFSVNAVTTKQKDFEDSKNQNVGERFGPGDTPTVGFTTTDGGVEVTSGNGVLSGTEVTAKTSSGTFDQDYHVDWGVTNDAPGTLSDYTEKNQEKAAANTTGYDVGAIEKKTWVGVQLEQNVYTVTGYVWVNGGGSGGIATDDDNGPTLTTGSGYVFKATNSPTGGHRSSVVFSVPRNVDGGRYVIKANGASGSVVLRYTKGQTLPDASSGTTANDETVAGWDELESKDHLPEITGTNANAFVIVVGAIEAEMKLSSAKAEAPGEQRQKWSGAGAPSTVPKVEAKFSKPYLSYTAENGKYTFTLENTGNVTLDVSLVAKKGGTPLGGLTGDNGVTFTDMLASFELAPKESKTFTVQIPEGMQVNGSNAAYTFEFTSKQTDAPSMFGPSLTYQLDTEVEALKVEGIDVEAAGDVYTPKSLKVSGKTQGSGDFYDGLKVSTGTADDVVYEWYAVPYGTKVYLNQTDGKLYKGESPTGELLPPITADGTHGVPTNGATYTENPEHAGQSVYLVARGVGADNSGNVVGAAFVDPPKVAVPFQMGVQILENGNPTTSNGNYAVYLVPREKATPEVNAKTPTLFDASEGVIKGVYSGSAGTWTVSGLNPELTYEIWTNAMGGSGHTGTEHMTFSDVVTSVTDFQEHSTPQVKYYDITIEDTKVDNQRYNDALKSADDTSSPFFHTYNGSDGSPLSGDQKAPTAKVGEEAVSGEHWIREHTTVNLTYPDWTKDYTLTWDGVTTGDTVHTGGSEATATVTVSADTTVKTQLQLNLYDLKAYVVGESGSVTEIKLETEDKSLTLTTKSNHDNAYLGLESDVESVSVRNFVTFSVPKASYTVTATGAPGTNVDGYRQPHDTSPAAPPYNTTLNVAVTDGTGSFDVLVSANGKVMSVADNAGEIDSKNTENKSAEAYYETGPHSGTVDQTITLPYGYASQKSMYNDLKLTLTVDNKSTGGETTLHDVKLDQSGADRFAGQISVTASTDGVKLEGEDMTKTETDDITVTITIPEEWDVGTYTGKLVFSFLNESGMTDQKAQVTYNLTVKVVPDKFTKVTTDKTEVKPDETLAPGTYTTTEIDLYSASDAKITAGTDYTYIWYETDSSVEKLEGTWDGAADEKFTPSTRGATKISGGYDPTNGELSAKEIATHQGQKLWLVIAATTPTDRNAKVIDAAVSDPITVGYQPVVKVTVDGEPITGPDAGDYTVQINGQKAVWDNEKGGYVPTSDGTNKTYLSSDTYTVTTSPYKGKSDSLVAWSGSKTQVDYYTVNAVAVKDYAGIPGHGETFDGGNPLPTLSFTLHDGDSIDDKTPVLKGQTIDAKATTWMQDYKLTWYTKVDNDNEPNPEAGAYETSATAMTKRGDPQDSGPDVKTSGVEVSGRLYIGARLDQNVYDLVGTVAGANSGYVSQVTVQQTAGGSISYTYSDGGSGDGTLGDKDNDGHLTKDDTVTFKVTKGAYTITAAASGAAVQSMTWGDPGTPTPGAELTSNTVAPGGTPAEYPFTITLEAPNRRLTVKDDATAPHTATGSYGQPGTAENTVEHYVHYINKKLDDSTQSADDLAMNLTLENPGNTDLTVNLQVYRGAAPGGTKVYDTATDSGSTVEVKSADDARTVLNLSSVMSRDTTVAAGAADDSAVKALTVTVDTGALRVDSGTYTFRFTGKSADGATVTVDYVLTLTVDPLPIVKLADPEPSVSDKMLGAGDTLTSKGLEDVTVTVDQKNAQVTANTAHLTEDGADPDVKYAWFWSSAALTEVQLNAAVTLSGGVLTPKGATLQARGSDKEYTVTAEDMDGYLYLAAYAPSETVNARDKAWAGASTNGIVSPPFETKKTAKVQVSLNGAIQPTVNTTDPGYTIYLVEDGKPFDKDTANGTTGTWATTWKGADKAYEAAIDTGTTYHVYAPTYKGSSEYVNTDLAVGKDAATPTKATVPYFTVNYTEDVTVDNNYDGFTSYLQESEKLEDALSVTLGGKPLASGTPVLKDQQVTVEVDATKKDATGAKGWSDSDRQKLHTLTTTGWSDNAGSSTGITYPDDDNKVTSDEITVNEAKTFSAKLEQVLFTVKFQVKDETLESPSGASVKDVTLSSGSFSKKVDNGGSGYNPDAEVTFDGVPAGDLQISATAGAHTLVQGYKWDGTDVVGNTITVTTDTSKNENTANNQILIIKGNNKITWKDNFDETTGKLLAGGAFKENQGFKRTDVGSYYRALYAGYGAADGLEYTVQVHNDGSNDLEKFTIKPDAGTSANFTFDLKNVTLHSGGGTSKVDVSAAGITLKVGDYVEFTVTIRTGKAAQAAAYTGKFTASATGGGEALGGTNLDYVPTYKVNAPFTAKEGKVLAHYGDGAAQFNSRSDERAADVDVTVVWDDAINGTNTHSFTYAVVDEAGRSELNTWLSANGKSAVDTVEALPGWLTMGGDGKVTFNTEGKYATGVDVKDNGATGWGDYDAHKVNNERVVYVKITDTNTGRVYYTTYTIDMEPGKLTTVEGASFDDTGAKEGDPVDLSKFSYTGVKDQANQSVADAGTGAAGGDITWTASPDAYVVGSNSYTFTGAYKNWNYESAETTISNINAEERTTVTLTYNVNGHGTLPAGVKDKVEGEPPLTDTLPTLANLTDYTFLGWSTNEHATEPDPGLTGGESYTVNENTTLYAVWEAKEYTYTFDANGGAWAGGAKEQTVKGAVDSTVNAPAEEPTWKDHTFLGWKDTAGTGGADITFPTTMPSGGGHAYAQWKEDESHIVYHWNYEGAVPESVQHDDTPGKKDTAPTTTRTGYSIEGWYTDKACEHKVEGDITFPAKDTTVEYYAKWERDQSKVTFDLNGGTIDGKGTVDPAEGNTGETVPDEKNPGTPVKDGWTFKGWSNDGGVTLYDFDSETTTVNPPSYPDKKGDELTLTAVWERNKSKIFYHWNYTGAAPEFTEHEGPTGDPDTAPTATRTDYTLEGWYTEAACEHKAPEEITYPKDKNAEVHYYANWTATEYTYTFHANGGAWDGGTDVKTVPGTVGAEVNAPTEEPTWKDHTFLGWKDAAGVDITFPTTMPSGGGHAYAKWEEDESHIVYHWNYTGADPESVQHDDTPGKTDTAPKPITRTGYVFTGWYTDDKCGEENKAPDEIKYPEKNETAHYYAGWRELSVALKFEDVRSDAEDVRDSGARITLVDPDATLTDMTAATPKAREVTRSGEYVVYLDTVPTYTVTLTNVGDKLEGMTLEAEATDVTTGKTYGGFLFTAEGTLSALEKDGTYTFTLTPDKLGDKLYAGTYHVKLTATGTAADGVTTATATYEITFQINKKTITKADVTGDKVTGKTDDDKPSDPDRDLTKPDDKGVVPVTPETKRPDSKTTQTTLKPDPNYEFVDEIQPNDPDAPTNTPNYTKNGKGDKDWPEGDQNTVIEKQANGNVVITTTTSGGGGGGGSDPVCPNQVSFLLGLYGTTKDATMEMVANNGKVSAVPTVSAIEGYKFLGWSQTGPTGDLEADAKRTLVDPKTVTITGDTVFYAVYQPLYNVPDRPFHEHYVIGYPNGNFGPGDNIDRASVATIIARAVLPNFVEGADYGNPLGYSDVAGHWAASAIAYCSKYGVFTGYEDGTFRPSQPISRQELALVMARLNGVLSGTAPFSDIDQAGDWAKDGIYTAYTKGWVNGYTDGTFKPLNPIRRDETVKIFNAYLGRGVDAKGLSALHEYVHSGVASNNTENGTDEYMTWPDVTADQWAYYEIIEAANDHEYATDPTAAKGYTVPETWTKCWIDERWRYHDDPNDGGPALAD